MKTLSSVELKQINRGKVYRLIYDERQISKHDITRKLNMSLPTVSLYLNEMLDSGMIRLAGLSNSTGGRRATLYECNPRIKLAIGLEILAGEINLVAVDVVGGIVSKLTRSIKFIHDDNYYKQVGETIESFAKSIQCKSEEILGVTISIQGLVSTDGETVTYSKILGAEGITLSHFSRYIKYSSTLIHDTSAAAYAEIWQKKNVKDSIFISLNRFIGSALIINGELYRGRDLCGSTIEHMQLYARGPSCYCGKSGCVQVFCSLDALEQRSDQRVTSFFYSLEQGDDVCKKIWDTFIKDIALMINNARMVFDSDVIIGGELAAQIREEDLETLKRLVKEYSTFPFSTFSITRSIYGKEASVIGGALMSIEAFLNGYMNG